MSSLPNPKDFNNFKIELSNKIEFDEMQQDYDLNNIYNSFKKNPIPAGYISKIFDIDILKYNPKSDAVIFYENENIQKVLNLKENKVYKKTPSIKKILNKCWVVSTTITLHTNREHVFSLINFKYFN